MKTAEKIAAIIDRDFREFLDECGDAIVAKFLACEAEEEERNAVLDALAKIIEEEDAA